MRKEEMLKAVKDPAGFIRDLMTVVDKRSKEGEDPRLGIRGELADLKVQGDSATGSMTPKAGKKGTMSFVRCGGTWTLSPGK